MTRTAMSFIERIIVRDIQSGNYKKIRTRFPPEPNGYLHLGHAKSIYFNFSLAERYLGECNLRFDDTNPSKESQEFVDQIQTDVRWLGFQWTNCTYTSNYFKIIYESALELIKKGMAYVDQLSQEQIREYRGTLTTAGRNSPYRHCSIEENLTLFEKMRSGGFREGAAVLRARIDMASPNLVMRDPVLYRIKFDQHHQSSDNWVIYPTYDLAHCISDAIEGISHSICTLEFQDNRALYDWILERLHFSPRPYQYEFARLNVKSVFLSKRRLASLVQEGVVDGWADPRMPTLSGLRHRGYPPEAIRLFCERLGLSKQENCIEFSALEDCVREVLNKTAPRCMGILKPLKLTLINLPEGKRIKLEIPRHPTQPSYGTRTLYLSRQLFLSNTDFQRVPEAGYKRLSPGKTVRLRYGCVILATRVIENDLGEVVALEAEADLESFFGGITQWAKPKGIIHWIEASEAVPAEFRLYQPLFIQVNEGTDQKLSQEEKNSGWGLNPYSCNIVNGLIENRLQQEIESDGYKGPYQFEREGYFNPEPSLKRGDPIIFHRTVTLRQGLTATDFGSH